MTRHLLRLVWNRKQQNLLLSVEILLAFLVLFGVAFFAVSYVHHWRQPLGFDIERIWTIRTGYPNPKQPSPSARPDDVADKVRAVSETFQRLFATLDALPNVEARAGAWPSAPYVRSGWGTGLELSDGRGLQTSATSATDDFAEVLRIRLLAGRWFSEEDDGAAWQPVVINLRLAREIFGDRDPINQVIPLSAEYLERQGDTRPRRVVGLIEEFRHYGEFAVPSNFMFVRARLDGQDVEGSSLPSLIVVRVTPGTTADFEETLTRTLQDVAPEDWSFELRPAALMREDELERSTTPLAVAGIVAAFLLLMVALGLTGVVWQSVTRRIQEFGLRRAKGATASNIQRQVMTELVLMTTLAVAVGVALVAQIPALPLAGTDFERAPAVWISSIAVSVGVIYLLTLLCGWYPSRLATKIQPAEALHYE